MKLSIMPGPAITVDPDLFPTQTETYPEDWESETTSIASSIYRGFMENGRRYQTLKQEGYMNPSDEQMFETYEAGHLVALILDSERDNPLFRSPIGDKPKHILDLGTGKGTWAIDVADLFQDATVRGVDLFPPPASWIPPNCRLEVDNVLKEWTWQEPFDLIHLRIMTAAFDSAETDMVYQECYDHIRPGGWIEQLEASPVIECDDNSLPPDSILRTWGPSLLGCAARWGRKLDTIDTMAESIRKAGFVDMHDVDYKWPIGPWPKNQQLKEAGTVNYQHWMSGLEGWCMFLLTKFGEPEPWSKAEVDTWVSKIRAELKNPRLHVYQRVRRVYARKPFPEENVSAYAATETTA
ncbi:hypothetical protein N7492_010226 [Penicillium capsulatum]|uniref:Uncharacterized protein n=1 Tax=Penicillium capsulatum TaxID=69766 RepID=A0A9W9HLY7_9EURO|nr:hypothetical protein N7492_010226 [Penicillium capsulatum]KAJ6112733.1 hypothetical protein N7512_008057 [Penicillium capsulatum]